MKNGQNTDLNNQNLYSSGDPSKARKGPKMKLPTGRTNFYVHEYRDITWNPKLWKIKKT